MWIANPICTNQLFIFSLSLIRQQDGEQKDASESVAATGTGGGSSPEDH